MDASKAKDRSAPGGLPPLGVARPRYGESLIKGFLLLCALVSVATTVGIIFALLKPTVDFFRQVPIGDFFFGTQWSPTFSEPEFGVLPLVAGTLLTTICALCVCLPFGLGTAIYLSEYSSTKMRKVLKPLLEVLAGIPTVVYGFFALTFVTPLLQSIWFLGDPPGIFSALSAGLVMGIMVLPTVASLSEDALRSVPQALRQGAFALGSSKRQVSLKVVVPAALSGIVAAFVLGISRAVGETMIVLIAAGGQPNFTLNPVEQVQTMTAFIASVGKGDAATGSVAYNTIFAVGGTLFAATFIMNLISARFVRKYREIYE